MKNKNMESFKIMNSFYLWIIYNIAHIFIFFNTFSEIY